MSQGNNLINDVLSASPNRRSLIKKLAMATVALGAASTVGTVELHADPSAPTPIDVLQFALNLEYLEAEFYTIATAGTTIDKMGIGITGSGNAGATTTAYGKVNFANNLVLSSASALDIADDERNHVTILRSAISGAGTMPIAKPPINLDALDPKGASLKNEATFLVLARIFEDIGVTAYAGGSTFLAGSPYLLTAARILAVEGMHASNIRLQIARLSIPTFALDAVDVPPPPSGTNFFATNLTTGLAAYRTPGQVLFLAYGQQANVTSGGFFPEGVNGNLHTSSAAAPASQL